MRLRAPSTPLAGPSGPTPAARGRGWLVLLPCALSLGVLALLGPEAFSTGVPANSDLTAHVVPVEILRTQLLPEGHFRGWTHAWYAGFPLYWFYFPVPAVAAALLATVLGTPLALRVVTLIGGMALPWALWLLARRSRADAPAAAGIVLVGSLLLLTTSWFALGGNLMSLVAGEFSYAWGLALSVAYLALVADPDRGSGGVLAGVVLALALLSHVLPAGAAAVGSAWGLLHTDLRRRVVRSWWVAGGVGAFWILPMLLRLEHVGERGWSWIPGRADVLPAELLLVLPAALLALRRVRSSPVLGMLCLAALFSLATITIPQGIIMRGRLVPVWGLAIHVLAGAGIGAALASRRRRGVAAGVMLGLLPLGVLAATRDPGGIRTLSTNVLEGIGAKDRAAEVEGIASLLREQPAGRVHWERTLDIHEWGGPLVFTVLPLRTGHPTLGGLFGESAPVSAQVETIDVLLESEPLPPAIPKARSSTRYGPRRGVELLRALGTRYLVTTTAATADSVAALPGTVPVGASGALRLFDLGEAPLVLASRCDEARLVEAGSAPGPDAGPAGFTEAAWARCLAPGSAAAGPVRDVAVEPHRIRFRTDAPGVPHLVRTSFFPNWRATGADRPRRAGWFMVVTPREESVTLAFRATWVEWAAWFVTGATVLGISVAAVRGRPRPSPGDATAAEAAGG